jgi:magnesium-transporting ATPase (P-type)
MLTGDHPRTAAAVGREVGLLGPGGLVVSGPELPVGDAELGALLDRDDGVVVARVTPEDKLRIARALRARGHVVAMTGDGVNDAPALREADVGVAMGAGGSDVAREAADLVLLDDHFGTIVGAVRLGRATFRNVRRFLTYHLSDNVAELAPFAAWALTGGQLPLVLGVLQVLALDIGTDMLPALALGAEPPSKRIMQDRADHRILRPRVLLRAFGLLGATEALAAMTAAVLVLVGGGWHWGDVPAPGLLALASGSAFAAISLGQMANAFACRSEQRPAWRLPVRGNPLLLVAVGAEGVMLALFLGVPVVSELLGGAWPPVTGWLVAVVGAALLLLGDGVAKHLLWRHVVAPTGARPTGTARPTLGRSDEGEPPWTR